MKYPQNKIFFVFFWTQLFVSQFVLAQEHFSGYNEYSLRSTHQQDQLYKRTQWLYMDLREKQNRPFFAQENSLPKLVIEAVKAGIIRPFQNDSLRNRMNYEDFIQNLTLPSAGSEEETWEDMESMDYKSDGEFSTDESVTGDWEIETSEEEPSENEVIAEEYFPNQLYVLEIKEDVIFDKKTSRMKREIQAITLKIPAEQSPTGLEKILASFSYKELVMNVFRDNPQAIWYNNSNLAQALNFSEAFENRLFSAHLIKYANGDDAHIEDRYGMGKSALIASQQIEYEYLDKEQDLWEN